MQVKYHFGLLFFKVFLTSSVLHFSPASSPLRTPASRPFLSRLLYPSHSLFSRAPTPLPPSTFYNE